MESDTSPECHRPSSLLSDNVGETTVGVMEAKVDVRLPTELRSALERERKRMSKALGAEVKTSFVVRVLLEQALRGKRRPATGERAA